MDVDKRALLAAVNDLISDATPQFKVDAIEAISPLRRRYPVAFTAALAVLNPLLDLRSADPDGYVNVQRLIDNKRVDSGLPPLWPAEGPERFDKVEYQRQLMAERRRRAGRALEIENARRPERDRLIGNARLEFERRQLAAWGKELQEKLDSARTAVGGRLPKETQDTMRTQFWESVDARMDEAEAALRRR